MTAFANYAPPIHRPNWSEHTLQHLSWRYGPERAKSIVNGQDVDANADVMAWHSFGRLSVPLAMEREG